MTNSHSVPNYTARERIRWRLHDRQLQINALEHEQAEDRRILAELEGPEQRRPARSTYNGEDDHL